jgi:hypothetical protein
MVGTATGALATGTGYEIHAKQQMDRLEDDYRRERFSRREYEAWKKQIEGGSIIFWLGRRSIVTLPEMLAKILDNGGHMARYRCS